LGHTIPFKVKLNTNDYFSQSKHDNIADLSALFAEGQTVKYNMDEPLKRPIVARQTRPLCTQVKRTRLQRPKPHGPAGSSL